MNTQIKWMTEYAEDFGNGKILGIGIFLILSIQKVFFWFFIKNGFSKFSFYIQGWYRGPRPALYVTDPDFLKEVLIKESETFIDRPMLDRSDTIPHLINLKGMLTFCEKHLQIIFFKKRWNSFSNFMEVMRQKYLEFVIKVWSLITSAFFDNFWSF